MTSPPLKPSHCMFLITMQNCSTYRNSVFEMAHWPPTYYSSLLSFSHTSLVLSLYTHTSLYIVCHAFSALTNPAQPRPLKGIFPDLLPAWCFLIVSVYMVIWLLCFRDEKSDNSRHWRETLRFDLLHKKCTWGKESIQHMEYCQCSCRDLFLKHTDEVWFDSRRKKMCSEYTLF